MIQRSFPIYLKFLICLTIAGSTLAEAKKSVEERNQRRDQIASVLKSKFAAHKAKHPKKKRNVNEAAKLKALQLNSNATIGNRTESTSSNELKQPSLPTRTIANQPKVYNTNSTKSGNNPKVELPANFQKEVHF